MIGKRITFGSSITNPPRRTWTLFIHRVECPECGLRQDVKEQYEEDTNADVYNPMECIKCGFEWGELES